MDQLAFTVEEFCFRHRMCRATFYNMLRAAKGPRVMRVGQRTMISIEAAEEWRREREAEAAAEKAA